MSKTRSTFNLGLTDQVTNISEDQLLAADRKMNRLLVDCVTYAGRGACYGVLLSFFFRAKMFRKVVGFSAGFGVGQAVDHNCHPYITYWLNQNIPNKN